MHPITIRYTVRPRRRSLAAMQVIDLFGLVADEPPFTVADNVQFDIRPGDVVLITGPSGSGKSSLLREIGRQLHAIDAASLELADESLIDILPGPIEERLSLLSSCGLAEARVMLRTPSELSDGQRYRFRLAVALSRSQAGFVLADEFTALLDRPLAKVVAFNLRKSAWRTSTGLLAATTHDDLADDLNPDVLIHCRGEGVIHVERRDSKKNESASTISFGLAAVPCAIGRTSLGGITAAMTSPVSGA